MPPRRRRIHAPCGSGNRSRDSENDEYAWDAEGAARLARRSTRRSLSRRPMPSAEAPNHTRRCPGRWTTHRSSRAATRTCAGGKRSPALARASQAMCAVSWSHGLPPTARARRPAYSARYYSMISSARRSRVCGILTPRALAVFMFRISLNVDDISNGSSAGWAPWRIRSTCSAPRRNTASRLVA
jgi:hypothetical protein